MKVNYYLHAHNQITIGFKSRIRISTVILILVFMVLFLIFDSFFCAFCFAFILFELF